MTNRHGCVAIRYIEGPRTKTNKVAIWVVHLILDAGVRIALNQRLVSIRGPRQLHPNRFDLNCVKTYTLETHRRVTSLWKQSEIEGAVRKKNGASRRANLIKLEHFPIEGSQLDRIFGSDRQPT